MRVAIDIGGTKTLVKVVQDDGSEFATDKHPTLSDFDKFIEATCNQIEKLVGDGKVEIITVAAPGLIDHETQVVTGFGNLAWKNVDIRGGLINRFNVPVLIENDANYGALGEANLGAGKDFETVLYITISTGIGTGVTFKGKLDPALQDSEGGHMDFERDGKFVSWESFASGKAFFEKYKKFGKDVPENDPIWKEWSADVAIGIEVLNAAIGPDAIVIGGSMGEHMPKYHDFLIAELEKTVSDVEKIPPVLGAKYPHDAVVNGCLVAMEQYLNHA